MTKQEEKILFGVDEVEAPLFLNNFADTFGSDDEDDDAFWKAWMTD